MNQSNQTHASRLFSWTLKWLLCAGELHIEVTLGELVGKERSIYCVSPLVVGFCETVTTKSSVICLGKSPNNQLNFPAEPLGEKLTCAIEQGNFP